jgi:hypothetical protein
MLAGRIPETFWRSIPRLDSQADSFVCRRGIAAVVRLLFRLRDPMLPDIKQNWFSNVRGDVLAGIVVALALIPEAIAFSIIAEVDPKVGLYASFCIAVAAARG